MRIEWIIDDDDIARVTEFYEKHRASPFVKFRIERNLRADKPPVSKGEVWACLVGCLLTTQQRSGPLTPVSRFIQKRPFPLSYEVCRRQADLAEFSYGVLSRFGGLRMSSKISQELEANMAFLERGRWMEALALLDKVRLKTTPQTERRAADYLADNLKGIGPKQSRNLLQGVGLSMWETPIDSRITKWLNEMGFPFRLSANALADRNYYNLVSEGFQNLCAASKIAPCVLDAAIFASYDGDGWTEENVVW
jgi:hypothetical protein